jgi:exopolysaccharide production protein ExoZ
MFNRNGSFMQWYRRFFLLDADAGRLLAFEGMRGVAVLLVFLVHYHALFGSLIVSSPWMYRISTFAADNGHSGVDLFFLLSGFLIYRAVIRRRSSVATFIWRRIKRIYPTFLFVFALYLALSWLNPDVSKLPAGWTAAVIYIVQNLLLLPGLFPITPMIFVAWSLSYEFFFYLTLPLLVILLGLGEWSRQARVAFFVGLTVCLAVLGYSGHMLHPRALMFTAGILLAEALDSSAVTSRLTSRGEMTAVIALALGFTAIGAMNLSGGGLALSESSALPLHMTRLVILWVTMFATVLYGIGFPGMVRSLTIWEPLRALGNMSYSYYLIHGFVLHVLQRAMPFIVPARFQTPWLFWAALPVAVAATILGSAVLFGLVEKRFSVRSSQRVEAAAVAVQPNPPAMAAS